MCDPQVDPEFSALIPKLSPEERDILESKILAEGMREPILTWRNLVIDGHNRLEICQANDKPYECREMKFASRNDAMIWMIRHQNGRRNLNASQRALLAGRLANLEKGANQHPPIGGPSPSAKSAAESFNVGERQVERARIVIRKATPKLAEAVTDGKVSVSSAAEVAKLPEPEQRRIVRAGPEAVKAAAKAIREEKQDDPSGLPDATPFDVALSSLKQVMGAIHALCGDGNGRKPSKAGHFLRKQRQELEGHVDELRRAFRFAKPYNVCPYCLAKQDECRACDGMGFVGEDVFRQAPPDMRAKVKQCA